MGGERAGPGDVAVASGIEMVGCFAEDPAAGLIEFAKGEVIGCDVLLSSGETLLGGGELVHESKTEVVLFAGEIDGGKFAAVLLAGFPADLAAKAGLVAGSLNVAKLTHKCIKDGLDEIPIFGATGEESAEPKFCALGFVDIESSEISLARGGDVEAEAEGAVGASERWSVKALR